MLGTVLGMDWYSCNHLRTDFAYTVQAGFRFSFTALLGSGRFISSMKQDYLTRYTKIALARSAVLVACRLSSSP